MGEEIKKFWDSAKIMAVKSWYGSVKGFGQIAWENNFLARTLFTPVQYVGFSLTWNFSGGKNVDVNVVDGIQDYNETKDY